MLNLQEPTIVNLNTDDINLIKRFGKSRFFKKKSTIFYQNDHSDAFYIIEQGQVKVLVLSQTGKINLLRILGPGDYFGELGLLDDKPRSTTIETLVDVELTIISKAQFISCLISNSILSDKFIPVMAERIRSLTDELTMSRVSNAYFCLRTKLYDLAAKQSDGTYLIEQKFTQQELGEFVGTARENINRFIKALKQGGYIEENPLGQWIIMKPLPQNW